MDHLSSCYFCGTAVDAPLGEYPVVPRELDPAPEHQTKIVLCSTCRRKLATVVGRIVDSVEDRQPTGSPPDAAEAPDAPAPSDDDPDETDGDGEPSLDSPAPSADDPGAIDADGPQGERSADSEPSQTDSPEPVDPAGDAPAEAGGDLFESVSVSVLEYNKVMRLLQNREFPVERAEIEAVATSAYDLSIREVNAVIDAAVERDLLREEEGELRRPGD